MKKLLSILSIPLLLSACATQSQDVYDFREAGQSTLVEFGTVLKVRDIQIKGENTGTGSALGAVGGAAAGSSIGGGDGRLAGALGGLVVGAVAGGLAEQGMNDKRGVEYTIVQENKKIITIPQYIKKEEPIFPKGTRVMIQTSGSYQRVLTAEDLPETVKRPKGIKVVD